MEFLPYNQARDLLQRSKRILCVLPDRSLSYDIVLSAIGLQSVLIDGNKEVVVYTAGPLPEPLPCISFASIAQHVPLGATSQVVSVDLAAFQLERVTTEKTGNTLQLTLFGAGAIPGNAVQVSPSGHGIDFDLVVYLGVPNYDSCQSLITALGSQLYTIPSIAIHNHTGGESFATINIIDVTVVSLVQLLMPLVTRDGVVLAEQTATPWLGGLMAATGSFQSPRMSVAIFELAAKLMEVGARHQELAVALFRTRSFKHLKLWGRLLARIEHDPESNLLWSLLPEADFVKSTASPEHVSAAALETLDHVSGFKVLFAAGEVSTAEMRAVIAASAGVSLKEIIGLLPNAEVLVQPWILRSSYQIVEVKIPLSLAGLQNNIQEKIIPYLGK
jgi:hypothetical protein